jgi:hypothetical protein
MALLRQCLQELQGREAQSITFSREYRTDVRVCGMRETPNQITTQALEICLLQPHHLLERHMNRPSDESFI